MACMIVHGMATPAALGANFEGRGHILGPENAPVTIVEFGNYVCPACMVAESSLRQVRQAHPKDVRFIYVPTPSAGQDNDRLAMQASEAADLQGKYWEMHDLLFDKKAEWVSLSKTDFEAWAARQATGLGMDAAKFQTDFNGTTVAGRLQQDIQASASPTIKPPILFVNNASPYTGLIDFPSLDTVIRMDALQAHQFSVCPGWVIDPKKQYIAHLKTAKGDVAIQLFADKSPEAVNNFVFLARSGWYNGNTFYKVISGSIALTGDPSGTGIGNPGYFFQTEIPAGMNFHQAGMVAMDNNGPNTNGSRFFITLAPAQTLDGQYTIIGQVLSGLEIVEGLSPRNPQPGVVLPDGDELIQVTIDAH